MIKKWDKFNESSGSDLFKHKMTECNNEILYTIDILTSLAEDLTELGFTGGEVSSGFKKPGKSVQDFTNANFQDSNNRNQYLQTGVYTFRYSLIELGKLISADMSKTYQTISYSLYAGTRNAKTDEEFNLVIDEFMNKLKEFAPNCRIEHLKREFSKNSTMSYVNALKDYRTVGNNIFNIQLRLIDSKNNRYKFLYEPHLTNNYSK